MGKKPSRRGEVGSQYWIRLFPESPLKEQMNMVLGDTLNWLSPLASDSHKEYQLNSSFIKTKLGIKSASNSKIFDFWPSRQPQWDGIAVSKSEQGGTLYLFEAKAHKGELSSTCRAGIESQNLIIPTMENIYKKYYSKGYFEKWIKGHYQLANRLTFLHKMKDMKLSEYPNVKLVLLTFVNDDTNGHKNSTSLANWKNHFQQVFKVMTGSESIPQDVIMIYHDVKHGKMTK